MPLQELQHPPVHGDFVFHPAEAVAFVLQHHVLHLGALLPERGHDLVRLGLDHPWLLAPWMTSIGFVMFFRYVMGLSSVSFSLSLSGLPSHWSIMGFQCSGTDS